MASDVPIRIHRGADDPPVVWIFENADGTPADLAGSRFDLTVEWLAVPARGGQPATAADTIRHSSDPAGDCVLLVDPTTGGVTWPITMAESRAIPRGATVRYELTRIIAGRTRPWAGGSVVIESYLP